MLKRMASEIMLNGDGAAPRRRVGRPAWEYDPEIAEEICLTIASTTLGLKTICERTKRYPSLEVIVKWLNSNDTFNIMYARSKELQAEMMGEELLDIADSDELDAHDKRVRVDTRKWLMSKMKPRKYGDKLDVTSGGEPLPPPSPLHIDARVQTIMLAAARRRDVERLLDD